MNFRRGFFRLWAVVAVVWALIVGVVASDAIALAVGRGEVYVSLGGVCGFSVNYNADEIIVGSTAVTDKWCREAYGSTLNAAALHRDAIERFRVVREEQRREAITSVPGIAAAAILPPAILLALGAALAWALSGFKRG